MFSFKLFLLYVLYLAVGSFFLSLTIAAGIAGEPLRAPSAPRELGAFPGTTFRLPNLGVFPVIVEVGGLQATNIRIVSEKYMLADAPLLPPGTYGIRVLTGDGRVIYQRDRAYVVGAN